MIEKKVRILGIDPGYGRVGWGVIDNDLNLIDSGCIETEASHSFTARLSGIKVAIKEILKEYNPHVAGVEELFFGRNVTTGINVAHARGVLLVEIGDFGIPIFEPKPSEVKLAVTGDGSAKKKQVMRQIKVMFNLDRLPRLDDMADAIGVAVWTEAQYRYKRLIHA